MKGKLSLIIIIIIVIIPLIYLSVVYNSLPPIVATHFDIDGKPDGYSTKSTLIFLTAFLSAMSVGVYFLITNIQKIDPKRAANQSKETMQKMAFAIVLLLNAISVIIIYAVLNNGFSFNRVLLPMLGLFFAWLGNLMHSVKPNYFVGIRTPWTLEDADTWRKTHQLAGKMWFAGGILITILALVTPAKYALVLMMMIIGIIIIVPVAYSYRYYQMHNKARIK